MRNLILSAMLAAFAAEPFVSPQPAVAETVEPGEIGGPFILVDQNGRTVTDEDFHDRVLMLTFGYTHCPDICPTTLMTFANALHALGGEGKRVTPVFVTLDPARDDSARLKDYVESFGASFVGLTGPQEHVAALAARYHVHYAKAPGVGADYAIDHSAQIFIVGPQGGVLMREPYDLPAAKLAESLRAALKGD